MKLLRRDGEIGMDKVINETFKENPKIPFVESTTQETQLDGTGVYSRRLAAETDASKIIVL